MAKLLITGGTGSFGNAVLKRFLETDIEEIRIFSRDEKKQDDMRKRYRDGRIKFYLGDVRDLHNVQDAMRGVDYVFHAAALKQVPSCEFFPMEAVKTNVIGTENVLTAAIDAGAGKVVCLSTDKAAYPVNAMGVSKAMMERVFVAKSRMTDTTVICGTRYGNVMGSRGSVIPLFVEQIKAGKPLTVTDPDMTRFLMDLDEAVDLVLFAFQNAVSGDIVVQKAPAATVGDLAQALKDMFQVNNPVNHIGVRHGEKLHETLLTKEESFRAVDRGNFYIISADNRDLNYDRFLEHGKSDTVIEEFRSDNAERLDVGQIKEKLLSCAYIRGELSV